MESKGTVNVGEATIEYAVHGTGETVVLLPGGVLDIT